MSKDTFNIQDILKEASDVERSRVKVLETTQQEQLDSLREIQEKILQRQRKYFVNNGRTKSIKYGVPMDKLSRGVAYRGLLPGIATVFEWSWGSYKVVLYNATLERSLYSEEKCIHFIFPD